jgi:hypothetical protein
LLDRVHEQRYSVVVAFELTEFQQLDVEVLSPVECAIRIADGGFISALDANRPQCLSSPPHAVAQQTPSFPALVAQVLTPIDQRRESLRRRLVIVRDHSQEAISYRSV